MVDSTRHRAVGALENLIGYPFVSGNSVKPLLNGDEIFPAMLKAIDSATDRIEFLSYIYWQGNMAQKFAAKLAERARAGVDVRIILDAFGAKEMSSDLIDDLEQAGAKIRWFRPLKSWKVWNKGNRTHRKVLVVDNRMGFTGGVGIAREWEGNARNQDEYRETHFQIEGPAVKGLVAAFYGNWAETGEQVAEIDLKNTDFVSSGDMSIQTVRSTASTGWSDIATVFQTLVGYSKSRLIIATAYFVPDENTKRALIDAVNRGVDVQILMPGKHTDERISQIAGEDQFKELLDGGVTLYKYDKTMFHSKIMLVDDCLSAIGSANFNQRSMGKDDEVLLTVYSRQLNGDLHQQYLEDLKDSRQVEEGQWSKRGLVQRCQEWVSKLFRSQT